MRPSARRPVNKRASASQFKKKIGHTKSPNMAGPPMRGGWRF